jgi:hypothetical protein
MEERRLKEQELALQREAEAKIAKRLAARGEKLQENVQKVSEERESLSYWRSRSPR